MARSRINSSRPGETNFYLCATLDGLGVVNQATGDYSSSPAYFELRPPAGEVYYVSRMIIHIADSGTIDADFYGNSLSLVNGIDIQKVRGSGASPTVLKNFLEENIFTNADWAAKCHDLTLHDFGSGSNHLTSRWTFAKAGGTELLDGNKGDGIRLTLNDDFSGLDKHHFDLQGTRRLHPDS